MILTKPKKILSLPKLLKKAQTVFNAFIRERDSDKCCITCPKYKIEQACHFYPAGQFSALRFNESNVHGGCIKCNYYKHGNLNMYRQHVEKRIGTQALQLLDSIATRHAVKKWERTELEIIIDLYRKK